MERATSESHLVGKEPCPSCGSKDNLGRYSDGHAFCFGYSCGYYEPPTDAAKAASQNTQRKEKTGLIDVSDIEQVDLPKRGLREATLKHFRYGLSTYKGTPCHVATHYVNGHPVAQHLRLKDKSMPFLGDASKLQLYGQWLWKPGGKMLTVTEGELDALSVAQTESCKWPVVSLPKGVGSAVDDFKRNLEFLESFDKVVLMFDMDKPGRDAALACAQVLSPGKAHIATFPEGYKDANDLLVAGKGSIITQAKWDAKPYRPDEILNASDLFAKLTEEVAEGYPTGYEGYDRMSRGVRKGEIVTFCAGTGIGKSTLTREIGYRLLSQGLRVGAIFLEESVSKSLKRFVSLEMNKPIHLPEVEYDDEELRVAFDKVTEGDRLFLYDHFGSLGSDTLISQIRYMARALDCDFVILDHLSIVVSGDDTLTDERRAIDILMTKLRSLVEETGIGLIAVSHLKRPDGKSHEEGGLTSLGQLRWSAAIGQISDFVVGLERNQQDPENRDRTTVRILKSREIGETGIATNLVYNRDTGRLEEESEVSPFETEY